AAFGSTNANAADLEKGKAVYQRACATCHGPGGEGDGPVAAGFPPNAKPASFVSGTFKKVTDDDSIRALLKNGGASMGLSPLMAPQPALSEEEVTNVIAFVRSLKK